MSSESMALATEELEAPLIDKRLGLRGLEMAEEDEAAAEAEARLLGRSFP